MVYLVQKSLDLAAESAYRIINVSTFAKHHKVYA